MAYMVSGNMDSGATDFQIEAAISKIFASVSGLCAPCQEDKCHFKCSFLVLEIQFKYHLCL